MANGAMNLTLPRSEKSVWDKPSLSATLKTFDRERWLTAAWGTALTLMGARRRGIAGGALAAVGSVVAARAAMGRRDLCVARRWVNRTLQERGWREKDIVFQASDQSFPASDSPSWTPTSGVGAKR